MAGAATAGRPADASRARAQPNGRRSVVTPKRLLVGLCVIAALLLVLPGETITTKLVNEFVHTLDGMYRVLEGQVPGRDFHTALGPLVFYLPAVGRWLTGSDGGALPLATALLLLLLAPVLAHVLTTRLRPLLALLLGGMLILVLVAPVSLGDGASGLTFAFYHDRIGWAALALLLVMQLVPRPGGSAPGTVPDALCAAGLTVLALVTKVTFGLAAVLFLLFVLTDSRQRRWAILALAITAMAMLLLALLWPGFSGHLRAVHETAAATGLFGGGWSDVLDRLVAHLADFVLLAVLAGLAVWQRLAARDAVFVFCCALIGLWIITHNVQLWGILTIQAAAAVLVETMLRRQAAEPRRQTSLWTDPTGLKLFFSALVLPTIVNGLAALFLHAAAATADAGRPLGLPELRGVRLANLWTPSDHGWAADYLASVEAGIAALGALEPPLERVLVLGRPDAFTLAMGLEPAGGAMPELGWGGVLDHTIQPPEVLLRDALIVVVPRQGPSPVDSALTAYLDAHFAAVAQTPAWHILRRSGTTR